MDEYYYYCRSRDRLADIIYLLYERGHSAYVGILILDGRSYT